jgi:dipeptidyl aminopeptidase/acylaminoacyl peptidase
VRDIDGRIPAIVIETGANVAEMAVLRGGFVFTPAGDGLVYVKAGASGGEEISRSVYDEVRLRVRAAGGGAVRTVRTLSRVADAPRVCAPREIQWPGYSGLPIHGLLFVPPARHHAAPLVVDVHGGPDGGIPNEGALLNVSPLEWQIWCARGYAVLVSDYRKGRISSRNRAALTRAPALRALDEADALDVLAGVDAAVARGGVDPDRVALIAHSYGAAVVHQLLTMTSRFRAAILKEHSFETDYAHQTRSPEALQSSLFLYNTDEASLRQVLADSSLIERSGRIRTPLIFEAGGRGGRISERIRADSQRLVDRINAGGGFAELMFFPTDQHVVREPGNMTVLLETALDWLDFWLLDRRRSPARGAQYVRWEQYRARRGH